MTNKIPLIVKGEGEPLVMLHGFMSCKEVFLPQIEYFSRYFKVYAYDLCGFGKNKDMPYPYELNDYCREFLDVVALTGEKSVNVIAHSFGCRVILKASSCSDVIKKAVLCGPAGLKSRFSVKKALKKSVYKVVRPFISREKAEKLFFSADYNMTKGNLKKSFIKVTNEHLDYCMKMIRCPVLVVSGENDRETPVYMGKRLEKNIPHCNLFVIEDTGHFCFIENSGKFNYVVREFLL